MKNLLRACVCAVKAAAVSPPWANWKDFVSRRFGLLSAGEQMLDVTEVP
jgi:hypothetical protein